MASLKETRTRIASVRNTRQVTSAMKMVSAAKLKKSQGVLNSFLPFTEKQHQILVNLAQGNDNIAPIDYFQSRDIKKTLLVVISSNRGLCGVFNANVIAKTKERILFYEQQGIEVKLFTIGKKAHQVLQREYEVIKYESNIFDDLTYNNVVSLANETMSYFSTGEFDKVEVIYNHSKSAGTQVVLSENYLPVSPPEQEQVREIDYIYEPDKGEILEVLVPQILRTQFYKSLLDSETSEHAARMIAMNKATDNAGDLLRDLKLEYNKARQAAITNEILEIVSGAEALSNG